MSRNEFAIMSHMKSIDISVRTILKFIFVPSLVYVVWINRDLVFVLFIAFILMSSLRPIVLYLHERRRVPRKIASLVVIVLAVVLITILFGTIIPPILSETITFIERLPEILRSLDPSISKYIQIEEVTKYVPNLANQVVSIVGDIFSNTLLVVLAVFFSYYLIANEANVEDAFINGLLGRHMSESKARNLLRIMHVAQSRLAAWFWGELVLMFAVGLLSYIGFSVIGIKYALPLAVLAGILEAVPNIGPVFTAAVAILIGFGQSPVMGIAALAVSFVVQQSENYILVPYIMRKAVGLNPMITMLSIILGMRMAGPLGALLAIPTYVFLESIYAELYKKQEKKEELIR
jgi:predicted PurR-regulated permease PerM